MTTSSPFVRLLRRLAAAADYALNVRAVMLAALVIAVSAGTSQAEPILRKTGSLAVPADAGIMVFSSDPLIQQTLSQDVHVAQRAGGAGAVAPRTLTVTVTQQVLKPGVSLAQVAPGAPEVADLIKSAGVTPPPLGDTGNQTDPSVLARAQAAQNMRPSDSPMQQILNQFQTHGDLGPPVPCSEEANPQPGCLEPTPKPQPGSPGYTGDVQDYVQRTKGVNPFDQNPDKGFDTVVVARTSLSGAPGTLTVVAVVHANDDISDAKKLVAETIADAVLH